MEPHGLFALVVCKCDSGHGCIANQDARGIHGNIVRVLVSVKMIRAARESGTSSGQWKELLAVVLVPQSRNKNLTVSS